MSVAPHTSPVAHQESPVDSRVSPDPPEALSRPVIIENVRPRIDAGRFPIKRTVAESIEVLADIFAGGHDVIVAAVRDRHVCGKTEPGDTVETPWRETPMTITAPGTDEWHAGFEVTATGEHEFAIIAWVDRFRSWRRDLQIKAEAGQDVSLELREGTLIIRDAAARASDAAARHDSSARSGWREATLGRDRDRRADADWLLAQADALGEATTAAAGRDVGRLSGDSSDQRVTVALAGELGIVMDVYADRSRATTTASLRVWVDRERARFGAWYEMFPRSTGTGPDRGGSFRDASAALAAIADLGFDVVYLPPIHPIGHRFRKGRNNSLTAAPDDPGSPWAIGSEEGGHTAIDPGLGTFEDFAAFRRSAERAGLEIALDLAWQCSPDHPWVHEHPAWFRHRPDGTIKYAENPPKKYQDIYPLDFECDDWRGLWCALLGVTLFWVDRGVRIFRVDNPHTKTLGFWEWLIAEVHAHDSHVIFLSEAFTRPKLMRRLAKEGFTQSYTYFIWRNTKDEIIEYFTELTRTDVREYLRPNLFANTPDIVHAYLQEGGRPAFEARLILAATLGASYGIYSGFELCESRAVPGTEEYVDSEKYQLRRRDWNRPGHIKELVRRVNRIRHQHPALQIDWTLRFHETDNPQIIAYSKSSPEQLVFVIVNLDPHRMQHGWVRVPFDAIDAGPNDPYVAHDLIDDARYRWHGAWNYVRFDPGVRQGHILRLERPSHDHGV